MSLHYRTHHYARIHSVEEEHFWFVARNEMIISLIQSYVKKMDGKRFLDVGCGTGVIVSKLETLGMVPTGLDINAAALRYAAKRTHSTLVRSSLSQYHPKEKFQAAGAFDVVEHVQDDGAFVRQCGALLEKGGLLFLTVPANPQLWSVVDTLSGHQRRYTKASLISLLEGNGFRIRYIGYWNAMLMPVYVMWRFVGGIKRGDIMQSYLKAPKSPVNAVLLALLRLENMIGFGHRYFGATLVVCAEHV